MLKGMATTQPIEPRDAARFLAQAAWGAAAEDIAALQKSGFAAWLSAQKAAPISRAKPYLSEIRAIVKSGQYDKNAPFLSPNDKGFAHAGNVSTAWMRNIVAGPDQLRQRVAWCLSQIMVVSYYSVAKLLRNGEIIADYYDTLATHALGNFRDLLFAVSTHPAMAYFLSALGNDKPDPANNQLPDENYAREAMQLFTIGLWELNPDGTQKLDTNKNPIPTYDNRDVEELARVFTGIWFVGKKWPDHEKPWPAPWLSDVKLGMFEEHHDRAAKTLFHGKPWQRALPANQDGLNDIAAAVDALVMHPNTAPFVSKALIKFLVTSNPSPAYVQRVSAVFANNGSGVRGDLFAVVQAILLDTDARDAAQIANPKHGKLQEPMLRLTHMVRAFNAGKDAPDLQFWSNTLPRTLLQWPLFSPSVFSFFSPGYRHLGTLAKNGLSSPEFQILNAVTVATLGNQFAQFIDETLHRERNAVKAGKVGKRKKQLAATPAAINTDDDAAAFRFDFSAEEALADTPDALLARLDLLLCNGRLDVATRAQIIAAVSKVPARDAEARVKLAVWLVAMSPAAAVLK
jgi:uncharacterized protein (DUF1800 family)